MDYTEFLESKKYKAIECGKKVSEDELHSSLFGWQKKITQWAIRKGRCAIFLDTGLGKTRISLEYARLIGENTLIIAPLSVARQTVREAKKIDLEVRYVRNQSEVVDSHKLWITNYEMVEHFDFSKFGTVVLDESSIIKSLDGKTKKLLIDLCDKIPYRLCCTATPAPNDYIELGNHAEFLGICSMQEMLGNFFINANKEHTFSFENIIYRKKGSNKNGTEWRLKHHAEQPFFEWLSTWAVTMIKPSDLGYDDDGFILPPLNIKPIFVHSDYKPSDQLFFTHLHGMSDTNEVRRDTLNDKLAKLDEILATDNGQWLIWCGLDAESHTIKKYLGDKVVEVKGSDSIEYKVKSIEDFQDGKIPILLTKGKIAGFGLNLQCAHNMIFFGINHSWETFYQCIRREWRYGQQYPVNVYIIIHDVEDEIYQNIMRKDAMAKRLRFKLIDCMKDYEKSELGMVKRLEMDYKEDKTVGNGWVAILGDSCERLKELKDSSIDLSVYSPPFASLFTYSASDRDLGNSKDWDEFFSHYSFIIREVLRVTKLGRLSCVHTSDIPAMAQRDGYIGIRDFPGEVIKAHEKEGWIFVGRAFVPKNPQAQAIRTHSSALLFVSLRRDSSDSRPALIDQILIFKKQGENEVPILPVKNKEIDNETWIEWANGIWSGISESDTLQFTTARGQEDEKHIAPLQLGTIERCIKLYSNPSETVLSPFMGIGSECYQAIKFGRKAIGIELKPEYFKVAISNLKKAESMSNVQDLFSQSGIVV